LKTIYLEVHTSFIAWAQTIIRRQALRYLKDRSREKKAVREIGRRMSLNPHYEISPVVEIKLRECLKKLSVNEKVYIRILNLRHLGFTFDEICTKLKITNNNAYVLLHRARKALMLCLKKGEEQ